MINKSMIFQMNEFTTMCTRSVLWEEKLPIEFLASHLSTIFGYLDSDDIENELKPIYDTFETLKLAEQYYKNHPIVTDWVEEPEDLEAYWDWNRCFHYASYIIWNKKHPISGVAINTEE